MTTKRQTAVLVLSLFLCGTVAAAIYPLKKSANGRYLVDQKNVPYLMLGDSPQALIVNLTEAEAGMFFADRKAHGFNTVWINLLCSTYTGGRPDGSTVEGILPFTSSYDLSTPNEAYFAHVDRIINLAAEQGIQVLLDPCETGSFLSVMLDNGTNKCRAFGQYLGNRYKNFPNIIWMSGNDFQNWRDAGSDGLVLALALGIKSVDTKHLHSVELDYPVSSSLDDSKWAPLISLNATYTYFPTYAQLLKDYNRYRFLPNFMVEAHYVDEDLWSALGTPAVLRRQEYWSMLSGAAGQLYGNHYTWQFISGWELSLNTPGSIQIGYLSALFESRAWYNLIPDQNHSVVTAGYGTFAAIGSVNDNDYATAARTADGKLVMVYMPTLRTITVNMSKLSGPVAARWYDPANGTYMQVPDLPFANVGARDFTPPGNNADGDADWVLVLETVPSPFIKAAGAYYGLFAEDDKVRQNSAGFFAISATYRGTYSGLLQVGAARYGFAGKLDLHCKATNVIMRRYDRSLLVELQIGKDDQADQITGRVSDGIWESSLFGDRAVFNYRLNPAPYAGRHTMMIPGQDNDPSLPAGCSFGTAGVDAGGRVVFAGALADGTRITQSVPVSKEGFWPLYVPLYGGKGSLMNWLTFTNRAEDDISGTLSWIKPADIRARYYPGGFTNDCVATGSVYVPPVGATNRVLNLTNGLVEFNGGDVVANFTNSVALGLYSWVTNLSSNRLAMRFWLSTGTFTGSAADPSSGRLLVFSGTVLQKRNAAYGFLLGTNQSSGVILAP